MALTAHDIKQIKTSVADVVEPRFADLKSDLDILTASTNRKFHAVFTDVAVIREDLYVVKQMVTEHGFRIARLENQPPSD